MAEVKCELVVVIITSTKPSGNLKKTLREGVFLEMKLKETFDKPHAKKALHITKRPRKTIV